MKQKIIKTIFPFAEKSRNLNKYWWHRLSVVAFFLLVFSFFVFLYLDIPSPQQPYERCIDLVMAINNGGSIGDACVSLLRPIEKAVEYFIFDLASVFIVIFVASYLLQFVYFKIILWILFGEADDK